MEQVSSPSATPRDWTTQVVATFAALMHAEECGDKARESEYRRKLMSLGVEVKFDRHGPGAPHARTVEQDGGGE